MANRLHTPSIDLTRFEGLYTKLNPEAVTPTQLRECINFDFFKEYGSIAKIRGTKRVLSSVYEEGAVVKSIPWGAFYKSQDLAGVLQRRSIIQAGTKIHEVNSDGSLTVLRTGEPEDLSRTSAQLDRFLYITGQDPFLIGKKGKMLRYDGTNIREWGVIAPGSQESVIESFQNSGDWDTSNCEVADSETIAFNGGSTQVTKTAGNTTSYIERLDRTPFAINDVIEDRATIYLYIPREYYGDLAGSGAAVSVYLGTQATFDDHYYRYDFQIGQLIEGWNGLLIDFSTFPTGDFGHTEGTPEDYDTLKSIRLEFTTDDAADTSVVYWDHFISLDQGTPSPVEGDLGTNFQYSASSIWRYRITFVDETGNESNSGPSSEAIDLTTGTDSYDSFILNDLPISANSAVIRRRIYRTLAGGSEYLALATVNNNTDDTYTDTTPDASLGSTTPPTAGATIFDNTPPPLAGICAVWKRTVFLAGDPINPTLMYFSRYDLPDAFPLLNTIEFDERVTGIFVTYVGIVVATETSFWRVISDNPDYVVDKTSEGMGCVGARATGSARVAGWLIDRDGCRLYDLQQTIKISEVIRDRVDAFYKPDLEQTHSAHYKKNNCLLWFTRDADGVYSDIYSYQYMLDDIRKGWYSQIVLNPTTQNFLHTFEAEDDDGEPRAYACGSDGMLYELYADDSLNWVNANGAESAISCELQTAFLRLGAAESLSAREGTTGRELEGVSGRIKALQLELRAKELNQAEHTWQVTLDTADSPDQNATVRDTITIDFAFPAGVSLLRLPIPNLIGGEYIRIKVSNSELGKDLIVTGVKLLMHLTPGQFVVTGHPAGQV